MVRHHVVVTLFEFEAAFHDVLERYGFRGVNEWEIASPSWEIRPDALRAGVITFTPPSRCQWPDPRADVT